MVQLASLTDIYKLALLGDRPGRPTDIYYAFIKRGRKQFRQSLKASHQKLADRRLRKLLNEIGNLDVSADTSLTFDMVAKKWFEVRSHTLKPRSIERCETSLQGLLRFFKGATLRNVTKDHCEQWITKHGASLSAQAFARELAAMKRVFDFVMERGLISGNPASQSFKPTRWRLWRGFN